MKKILVLLIFLFVSIFTYSDSAFSYSKSVNIDFDIGIMMGLTKVEKNNNQRYKKFLNYIDENLAKKNEVKYSHKLNMDKRVVEFFSEKGDILLTENLPKEFLDIIDNSIRVAVNKEEIKKTIKNIYEDPYTYVSISKYKENLILFIEENIVNRGKIKNTISVVLKRELTDAEKNDLIYLKDNDSDEFFKKYRAYLESETTKTYINDKLEFFQEIRGLTEINILYKNEISKVVIEYTDDSRINSVYKAYRNDRLLTETFFKNKEKDELEKTKTDEKDKKWGLISAPYGKGKNIKKLLEILPNVPEVGKKIDDFKFKLEDIPNLEEAKEKFNAKYEEVIKYRKRLNYYVNQFIKRRELGKNIKVYENNLKNLSEDIEKNLKDIHL